MEVWPHRWWWYEPRFRIKSARLPGGPAGAEIWSGACLRVHMCTKEALANQQACVLALTSCSFLYANSSFVCWQAHWQLHVGWGKVPVRIIHGPQQLHKPHHDRWKMMENVACAYRISYFEMYFNPCGTCQCCECRMDLGYEVFTVGKSDRGHEVDL